MFSEGENAQLKKEYNEEYMKLFGSGPENILSSLVAFQNVFLSAAFTKISLQLEDILIILEKYDRFIEETQDHLRTSETEDECHSLLHESEHISM